MVESQVRRNEYAITRNTFDESGFSFTPNLDIFNGVDVLTGHTETALLHDYEFEGMIKSSGVSPSTDTGQLKIHRITVGENIPSASPLVETTFFSSVVTDDTSDFHVLPDIDTDGKIQYALFYTFIDGGATTNLDLTVATFKDPPNTFSPTLTTNTVVHTKIIRRHVAGNNFVYDYFVLSIP